MLQNHCKGIYFSPNNQKKTQKKSQTWWFFLIRAGYTWKSEDIYPMITMLLFSPARWYRKICVFRLFLVFGMLPCSAFRLACPRTLGLSSRTYCGCLRTSLRTKTVSSPNFSPNFHCFHNEWGLSLRISNGCRPFQKIFQIHIIYTTRINFVINPSKDWPFNQILAYLWSFLSISAFIPINYYNFAVKQQ